jgi:hypothetical protein
VIPSTRILRHATRPRGNILQFRGGNGSAPQPPVEPMGPRLAAFFLRRVCVRLDRLQSTLTLLHDLKAKRAALPLASLADLCSDEAGRIYADFLLPVVRAWRRAASRMPHREMTANQLPDLTRTRRLTA